MSSSVGGHTPLDRGYDLPSQQGRLGEAWQTIRQLTALRIALVLVLVFVSRFATFGRWYMLLKDQTPL